MKICSKTASVNLWKILLYFYFSFVFSFIWNSTMHLPFTIISRGVNGRCIHDNLDFEIQGQSPQSYNGWMKIKQTIKPINEKETIHEQNDQTPIIYVPDDNYNYDDDDQVDFSQTDKPTSFVKTFTKDAHPPDLTITSQEQKNAISGVVKSKMGVVMHNTTEMLYSYNSEYRQKRNSSSNTNKSVQFGNVYGQEDHLLGVIESSININEDFNNDTFTTFENNITYKPIRLTLWYDYNSIVFANNSVEYERLKQGVDRAVEQVQRLFSVIPIHGNLLLHRLSACGGIWLDPSIPNVGKCGRILNEYAGEKCMDDFKIPDDHLSGFSTYDRNGTEPNAIYYENGTGLPNTDIVMYIRSKVTHQCSYERQGIIAYATFCQLDQFNRPIAGYANFCPSHLTSQSYDPEKFYLTVLHEFFHVLGFSQKLFKKFQTCQPKSKLLRQFPDDLSNNSINDSLVCESRSNVVDFVNDWYRILTPSVGEESRKHFNCSFIGGPLEGTVSGNLRESSHWESRYIQPSLMTASIGLPHLTILDRITLAVFKDTGWYRVNMSYASELLWGKNAGCSFGSVDSCHEGNSSFFCTGSESVTGCHYLHLDKGVCKTNEFLDSCKVYKVNKGNECWDPKNAAEENANPWKGETYNIDSRCFISNLSPQLSERESPHARFRRDSDEQEPEARCYEHRCNDTNTLEIRVRGSAWVRCASTVTRIPGYNGYIICPPPSTLCNAQTAKTIKARSGSIVCIKAVLTFPGLLKYVTGDVANASAQRIRFTDFSTKFNSAVDNLVQGNGTSVYGQLYWTGDDISFYLKSKMSNTGACTEAVRRLKVTVNNRVFSVSIENKEFMASKFAYKYTLQPCGPQSASSSSVSISTNSSHSVFAGDVDRSQSKSDEKEKPPLTPPKVLPWGIIAASAIGAVCASVFASVGAILYFKSMVPNAVGPASSVNPEVSYQPTSQGSPATVSEDGSVGQIEFSL